MHSVLDFTPGSLLDCTAHKAALLMDLIGLGMSTVHLSMRATPPPAYYSVPNYMSGVIDAARVPE